MILKEKLLNKINMLREIEKRLDPLFGKYISSALFFSKLKSQDREEVKEYFFERVKACKAHMEVLESIAKELSESKDNVY
ncbi:MAG: hypothetical protein PHU64_00505 [Candidatus Omnitrophica bacterium]|jgi:predicted house-cleaning noncanonical NTP pyrophosphatase (MazG superfamily)|nr:hypothetical protein [Candidatus Omnitrophota bacterium]MDD5429829.1 hypothetical protein [Candidatus Omnitrophota bacterium]